MKNLKKLLGLMAISGIAFGFASNVNAQVTTVASASACSSSTYEAYVKFDQGYKCYSTLKDAVDGMDEGGTITLVKDVTVQANGQITFSNDIVLNLNGKTLTLKNGSGSATPLKVTDSELTIKNGKITVDSGTHGSLLEVAATSDDATITIAKDIKFDGANQDASHAIFTVSSATENVEINVAGKWSNLQGELVDCSTAGNETINLNAEIEGAIGLIGIDAGDSVVNVTGGSYTSDTGNTFKLQSGTLNITGGTILAKADDAIYVDGTTSNGANNVLKISGNPTITSKSGYSVYFKNDVHDGSYDISGGTFTSSGKKAALSINDPEFLEEFSNIITGGKFTNGVVEDTEVGDVTYTAAEATKALVKGETTEKDGVVTVGKTDTTTTDPGTTDEPGKGDETTDKNPQTYDGIMSYVTLAISSLGALGFATKKVLF